MTKTLQRSYQQLYDSFVFIWHFNARRRKASSGSNDNSHTSTRSLSESSSSRTLPLPPQTEAAAAAAGSCVDLEAAANRANSGIEKLTALNCSRQDSCSSRSVGNIYDTIDNVFFTPSAAVCVEPKLQSALQPDVAGAVGFSAVNTTYIQPDYSTTTANPLTRYMNMSRPDELTPYSLSGSRAFCYSHFITLWCTFVLIGFFSNFVIVIYFILLRAPPSCLQSTGNINFGTSVY